MSLLRKIISFVAFFAASILGFAYMGLYMFGGQEVINLIACIVLWIYAEHLWAKTEKRAKVK